MKKTIGFIIVLTIAAAFFCPIHPVKAEQVMDEKVKYVKDHAGQEVVDMLYKNGFVITSKEYKQVYQPYLNTDLPFYITTDSLLNAFHVLYEESVVKMETANTFRLKKILTQVRANVEDAAREFRGDEDLKRRASLKARIVISAALAVLGEKPDFKNPEIEKIILNEAARIKKAQGTYMPRWFGLPDEKFAGLDYSRYKPRGFYTKSPRLQRYFRAVSWLQSIPFRIDRDDELLAILILGKALKKVENKNVAGYFECYRQFIGQKDDLDVTKAMEFTGQGKVDIDVDSFNEKRKKIKAYVKKHNILPMVYDQIRSENPTAKDVQFRFLSAYRVPDAVLFMVTTDPDNIKRAYPSGLEICTVLGSKNAKSALKKKHGQKIIDLIKRHKGLFDGDSLYVGYLFTLSALFETPEKAPEFMKSKKWGWKMCQTALAGWAQIRHTWALQIKQSAFLAPGGDIPKGFVEPYPEFYARMGKLASKTHSLLKKNGAFSNSPAMYAADIRNTAQYLKKIDYPNADPYDNIPRELLNVINTANHFTATIKIEASSKNHKKYWSEVIVKLNRLADDMEAGRIDKNHKISQVLERRYTDIEPQWIRLEKMCRTLNRYSKKQLKGEEFTEKERRFFESYGGDLAGIMLYGGNSYWYPKDDAPRIVDVFSNPQQRQYLEVGIGRARAILVLYPHKGRKVLCRGAVMPYYEFKYGSRLDDVEWKNLLKTDKAPDLPVWLRGIYSKGAQ